MLKVLIVDDEPAMLLVLKRMLLRMEGVELVGSFRSAAEALDFVRGSGVDLAILDIEIAADDGLELARSMRLICTELDIVFTTSHAEFALDAYDIYPLDYMVKPISRMRLAQTIARAVNRHNSSYDSSGDLPPIQLIGGGPSVTESFEVSALTTPLTLREIEVLRGIANGWTNEEIAERLQIRLSTVKVHIRHVFAKLEVHNRVSAVTRAQHLSLLEK